MLNYVLNFAVLLSLIWTITVFLCCTIPISAQQRHCTDFHQEDLESDRGNERGGQSIAEFSSNGNREKETNHL